MLKMGAKLTCFEGLIVGLTNEDEDKKVECLDGIILIITVLKKILKV